ncbi:hypothetical protein [Rhodospirillaceae bacterium SYSU D60014]|uniref:hypothetical protein n=1 Tax=Virgifigura deserti TaxID=2268457 RepID=UPI000E670BED
MLVGQLHLIATKLCAPIRRTGLVHRHRLLRALHGTTDGKLTVVAAPAGFGKSTLLAQWHSVLRERNAAAGRGRCDRIPAGSPRQPTRLSSSEAGVSTGLTDQLDASFYWVVHPASVGEAEGVDVLAIIEEKPDLEISAIGRQHAPVSQRRRAA